MEFDKQPAANYMKFNSKINYKMANIKGKVNAGKVLIKPIPAEEKTASGIIIPASA